MYVNKMENTKLYQKVNIALIEDNNENLKSVMPLIRGIDKYVTTGDRNKQYKVYRGGWLPKEFIQCFTKNAVFRVPCIWSLSQNKSVKCKISCLYFVFCILYFLFCSLQFAVCVSSHCDFP